MLGEEAKLTDAGIDYLRVTTQDRAAKNSLMRYYRQVRERDEKQGYKEQNGGAFGFVGKKCRHALFGEKREWAMLQVSGYEAKLGWQVAGEGTQASRIDLQLTIWVGSGEVSNQIRRDYEAACRHVRPKARPIEVKLIESRGRAQTLYLGSRSSDVFCREYDKFEESGKPEHEGCVRYEVELKGRASKALWAQLVLGKTSLRKLLELVMVLYGERGIKLPIEDLDEQDIRIPQPEKTKTEDTLMWLNRQVAPTVARLVGEMGYITPFRVLFEQALTDFRKHRIMRMLSVVWGS